MTRTARCATSHVTPGRLPAHSTERHHRPASAWTQCHSLYSASLLRAQP